MLTVPGGREGGQSLRPIWAGSNGLVLIGPAEGRCCGQRDPRPGGRSLGKLPVWEAHAGAVHCHLPQAEAGSQFKEGEQGWSSGEGRRHRWGEGSLLLLLEGH